MTVGEDTDFSASARLTDRKAGPLKFEWDFAGGAMGHPTELTLRCHSGQSEQCYHDRMFTAGTTCYDCHGSGVLGGPHSKHPVNDPNWWKEAQGNTEAGDTGTSGTAGGWHNDLAKQPGKQGEHQCAACHGNDRK